MKSSEGTKRQLSVELDRLEARIEELRILYEQFFVGLQPLPPDKQHRDVKLLIRQLLKAPFKNSENKFRLRALITRFQTYATYWERVNKQREEGTYVKDIFKADMRQKMLEDAKQEKSSGGAAEKGLKQLFSTYEAALKKAGARSDSLNFDAFKRSILKKAKQLKSEQGVKKLHYKVVIKQGKVTIKASKAE